ncbi:MAG: haloalkane dehalogenase [Pseudomonadota bacterium]
MSDISSNEHPKQFATVKGKRMAYVEMGEGVPVLFLHGNPTSSYLWRNVMPHVPPGYRAIAPDLIGMGDSDKLDNPGPDSYRFVEHRAYLDALLDKIMTQDRVYLVIHDWGSALGFDWARRNAERVAGICFMEGIVAPVASWAHWNEQARPVFQGLRSPAGDDMILNKNLFIERILPGSILRNLSDEEMAVYRRPFAQPGEDRRPTLTWPRQIPIEGEPEDVNAIVADYAQWLPETDFPKLFVNAEPGAILLDHARAIVRSWRNVTEVTVPGSHFIQEDSPHEIGLALRDWLGSNS